VAGFFCVIDATADSVQACDREFWNELGGAGQQGPLATPDVANASDPHSENTSGADACLRLSEQDVQKDYCGEEESEVDDALES
jgi:predicted small lipoprotein YifL